MGLMYIVVVGVAVCCSLLQCVAVCCSVLRVNESMMGLM